MSDKSIFTRNQKLGEVHVNIDVNRLGADEPKPATGTVFVVWPEKHPNAADAAARVRSRLDRIFGSAKSYDVLVDTKAPRVNVTATFELAAAGVPRLKSLWTRIVAAINDDG